MGTFIKLSRQLKEVLQTIDEAIFSTISGTVLVITTGIGILVLSFYGLILLINY